MFLNGVVMEKFKCLQKSSQKFWKKTDRVLLTLYFFSGMNFLCELKKPKRTLPLIFSLEFYVIFKNNYSVEQSRTLVTFPQMTLAFSKPTMETPEPCVMTPEQTMTPERRH